MRQERQRGWVSHNQTINCASDFRGMEKKMLKDADTMNRIDFIGIAILVFGVVGFMLYSGSVSYDRKYQQERQCEAIGAKRVYFGDKEGYGCQKEYQSCGPDESKPGYTICEQKFKRVYPEGGV